MTPAEYPPIIACTKLGADKMREKAPKYSAAVAIGYEAEALVIESINPTNRDYKKICVTFMAHWPSKVFRHKLNICGF